jgi:hypothetical protein
MPIERSRNPEQFSAFELSGWDANIAGYNSAFGAGRMHGGKSTGPRTPEGLQRSRRSNWKHGHYSAEAKRVRRDARQQYRLLRQLIAAGNEDDLLDLISSM